MRIETKAILLGECAQITKLAGFEYTKHFNYQIGGEVIALRSLNIRNGRLDLSDIHTIPKAVSDALPRSQLKRGDIVLGYVGSNLGNLAKIEEDNRFHLAPNVALIRPNKGVICDFLLQYMQSEYLQSQLWTFASSTGQPALSMANIRRLPVFLPPIGDQKKIARILSTWDKAISVTEKLLSNSQLQKKALMQQLLTGKKRLLDDKRARFSGEWKRLSLQIMAEIIVSPVDKKTEADEIPVELCNYTDVYYNNVITNNINFMKATATKAEIEKYTLKKGDVIITKDSETPGDIAIPALVSENLNGVVCGYHLAIIRPRSKFVIGAFLNYLFSMQKTRYYFFTLATGATRFGLSVRGINHAHFNIPDIVEQQKIAEVLSAADAEISTLEKKLTCLKDEKKALMQQLLTGKRRVSVPVKVEEKEAVSA